MDPEMCYLSWTLTLESEQSVDQIMDVFMFVDDETVVEITAEETVAAEAAKVESAEVEAPADAENAAGADAKAGQETEEGCV